MLEQGMSQGSSLWQQMWWCTWWLIVQAFVVRRYLSWTLVERPSIDMPISTIAYICIYLWGRAKGKTTDHCHMLPLAMTTALGLKNDLWIQRLLNTLAMKGITMGALIWRQKGGRWWVHGKIVDLDPMFHDYLQKVQVRRKDIIPIGGKPCKLSSIYRSLQRGLGGKGLVRKDFASHH
jgi:hypothetical protein